MGGISVLVVLGLFMSFYALYLFFDLYQHLLSC